MKNSIKILAVVLVTVFLNQACENDYDRIEGMGAITKETLSLENFSGISQQGIDDVFISYGPEQKVEVVGHPNIISRIKTKVRNDIWYIELEKGNYRDYELDYYITIPSVSYLATNGTANVEVGDFINQDNLRIVSRGTGNIHLNRMENTESLSVKINGTGDVNAMGEFPSLVDLDIETEGTGGFYGFPVESRKCKIDILGTGNCEVSVVERLEIKIEGSGSVYYKGNPIIDQRISGSGKVKNRN